MARSGLLARRWRVMQPRCWPDFASASRVLRTSLCSARPSKQRRNAQSYATREIPNFSVLNPAFGPLQGYHRMQTGPACLLPHPHCHRTGLSQPSASIFYNDGSAFRQPYRTLQPTRLPKRKQIWQPFHVHLGESLRAQRKCKR